MVRLLLKHGAAVNACTGKQYDASNTSRKLSGFVSLGVVRENFSLGARTSISREHKRRAAMRRRLRDLDCQNEIYTGRRPAELGLRDAVVGPAPSAFLGGKIAGVRAAGSLEARVNKPRIDGLVVLDSVTGRRWPRRRPPPALAPLFPTSTKSPTSGGWTPVILGLVLVHGPRSQ